MRRIIRRRSEKAGKPPGTIFHVGEKKTEKVKISVINYDEMHYAEKETEEIEDCFEFLDKRVINWVNITGIHQVDVIEKIGKYFELHPLLLEDIVNTEQRPKVEDFGNHIFIVFKVLFYKEKTDEVLVEQASFILGPDFVISFLEMDRGFFLPIKERIRNGKGKIKKMGADYLAYALIDAIVDNYFGIFEKIGDKIDALEEELVTNPVTETLQKIQTLKREMIVMRKSVWPLREVVSTLQRMETSLIKDTTDIYLRDVHDHSIQIIDTLEVFRDMIAGMLDIYLSSVSNKMNEVMKVLTLIATIFIPLTFISGIYGMNFRYMPELELRWGYFATLLIMGIVGIVMVFYFWKKKWL